MRSSILVLLLPAFMFLSCSQEVKRTKEVKQYSINQFYKNVNISGGSFSTNDSTLLFSNNKSGIYNAYEIRLSNDSIQPLTHSPKFSIFAEGYVPGTQNFIYSADQEGNERTHLYLKTNESVKDLTPGAKEKAMFGGWSHDGRTMYYVSNKRDPRFFDLYKMDTVLWKTEMIYQNNNGLDVGAFSNSEKYLLLTKAITSSKNDLFLYDRESKEMKKISKDSANSNYYPLQFTNDNRSFYYLTNEGGEFTYVMKYNIFNNTTEKIFETNWDVMYMYLSYNEKYRVIGINQDGKNVLKIFDNKTNQEIDFPEIKDGDIVGANISKNENNMCLTVGSSTSPNNLYVYNFHTKKLKQLTNTLNPEINSGDLAKAEVVAFKSFDGKEIPAIYYKPLNASADHRVPALVWVHGGPGGQSRIGFNPFIQYLVNHGYAILAVNNRGSSGYGQTFFKLDDREHGGGDLMDCVYGKKYLASLDYIDSTKIGILGGSYGGFMTLAALCFHPEVFDCGVDFFGVANWIRTLKSIPSYWASMRDALYAEMGNPNTKDSVMLKKISPLFHADLITKPLMVLQGVNDPRVMKAESDEIVQAVKENNVPVKYVVFPDEGHGFIKKDNEIKADSSVLVFLNKHLKGESQ
ncbi:MAG TPA: S9 family peptidase [Chitinophagaceae bacterium]|nr:S9 family peptidase [Chitinophagaceae bacterium]